MKKIIFCMMGLLLSFPAESMSQQETVSQQFQGFNLQGYTDGGDKAWDVHGDTADILNDTIAITNVDANQYGEYDVNIKARTGVINKASGDIQLENDVVITSQTGTRLTTDYLQWQKEKDLVETEKPVILTDKGMTATGTGLRAQPALKIAKMERDVTVNVKTKTDQPQADAVTITCDGPLEIDQKVNIAVFHDNVVAVQKDRTLKADKMDVYFNPQTKTIEKVVCIGHVVIIQGGNTTYAEKAVYDAEEQKFTLTGRPKLILITEGEEGIPGFPK